MISIVDFLEKVSKKEVNNRLSEAATKTGASLNQLTLSLQPILIFYFTCFLNILFF